MFIRCLFVSINVRGFWHNFLHLVIGTEVAVFANSFGVKDSITMRTKRSLLGPTFGMITVLARTIGIVRLFNMSTF